MNLIYWYVLLLALPFGALFLCQLWERFNFLLLKHLCYPLLFRRKYWFSVTRAEGVLLIVYVIINSLGLGLGIHSVLDLADLAHRAGLLAVVNLIPLFLGGRTNSLGDSLNISLHAYYFAHHWAGRMAIIQGVLHVALVVSLKGIPRTNANTISGAIVSLRGG